MTPFGPLYPWLDACALSLAPIDPPFNVTDLAVDCRDIGNRLAILQILATHGHRHPWALGGIWSALTDEQAGRVVAEMVRRVGADPTAPHSPLPVGVLGPIEDNISDQQGWWKRQRRTLVGADVDCEWFRDDCGGHEPHGWRFRLWSPKRQCEDVTISGPTFGDESQRLAEQAALDHYFLLIEQITPSSMKNKGLQT